LLSDGLLAKAAARRRAPTTCRAPNTADGGGTLWEVFAHSKAGCGRAKKLPSAPLGRRSSSPWGNDATWRMSLPGGSRPYSTVQPYGLL